MCLDGRLETADGLGVLLDEALCPFKLVPRFREFILESVDHDVHVFLFSKKGLCFLRVCNLVRARLFVKYFFVTEL